MERSAQQSVLGAAVIAAFAIAGCSSTYSVDADASVADANMADVSLLEMIDATADDESACDAGTVAMVSTSPATGELAAPVLTTVTLRFDGSLAADSVTNESVTLLAPHATVGVEATVEYHASEREVVLTPLFALEHGSTYRVHTSGLRSLCGHNVDDIRFSFGTRRSWWDRQEQYDRPTPTITRISGQFQTLRPDAVATHVKASRDAGADGLLGTEDDDIFYEREIGYSADGRSTIYYTPGPDTMFGTEDDEIDTLTDYDNDSELPYFRYAARTAGMDGIWLTADDGYSELQEVTYGDFGELLASDRWTDIGIDGLPFTDDDVRTWSVGTSTTPTRRESRTYNAGSDMIAHTSDDQVIGGMLEVLNEQHKVSSYLSLAAGPDQIYFTEDDLVAYAFEYEFEPLFGQVVLEHYLPATSAPLATWFSTPRSFYYYSRTTYDEERNRIGYSGYNAGADGMFGTADDLLNSFTHFVPGI